MSENKQCLQRDITEVYVSKRGAGRTCLMFVVKSRRVISTLQWSRPRNERQHSLHVATPTRSLLRRSVVPAKVFARDEHTLLAERETPNALVVVWFGNEALHGSRNVTLHRLRLSAHSRDLSQRIPG